MEIVIRKATIEDVETISSIYAQSWKQAYRGMVPQDFLDNLQNDNWVYALKGWITGDLLTVAMAFYDGIPAGGVIYGRSRDKKLPDWGEIQSIYVHPDYYRKGIGHQMLQYAVDDLRSRKLTNCFLWVLDENISAQKFYQKNGFVPTNDTLLCEIAGKNLTDFRYVLTPSSAS